MPTAQDIINLANAQPGSPGSVENPPGSNRGTKYHAWYGPESQGWQWCAIFVDWVFWHVDKNLVHGLKSAYSGDYLSGGLKHGEGVSAPRPGCIAIMDYGDGGITDHIGIVITVSGNTMTLVEGNHNNRVEFVRREWRGGSTSFWFIYPQYGETPIPEEETDMSVWTSGEAVEEAACPCFVGIPGGRTKEENCWAKVLNLSGQVAKVRFLAISNSDIDDLELVVEVNKSHEISAKDIGLVGPGWMHIKSDRKVMMGFDVR